MPFYPRQWSAEFQIHVVQRRHTWFKVTRAEDTKRNGRITTRDMFGQGSKEFGALLLGDAAEEDGRSRCEGATRSGRTTIEGDWIREYQEWSLKRPKLFMQTRGRDCAGHNDKCRPCDSAPFDFNDPVGGLVFISLMLGRMKVSNPINTLTLCKFSSRVTRNPIDGVNITGRERPAMAEKSTCELGDEELYRLTVVLSTCCRVHHCRAIDVLRSPTVIRTARIGTARIGTARIGTARVRTAR